MDCKLESSEGEDNVTGERFRHELDKWFQKKGILADLRSYLRHSMIMALQNGLAGPKPMEDASPKTQAVSLLVAEFLFRRGCHYTLSVFASEVPTLTGFRKKSPGNLFQKEKPSVKILKNDKRIGFFDGTNKTNGFQEKEIEEILNALGLWSVLSNDIDWILKSYFQETNKGSLLELFLQLMQQLSSKLNVQLSLESANESNETLLPARWNSQVVNILVSEKLGPARVVSIHKLISRVTETEFKKILNEERKQKLGILEERERRIQNWLENCEKQIYLNLNEAEKEFKTRKESIEKELVRKQRHLSKLVLDWNAKHEDIIQYAKYFYNLRKENKLLKKMIEGLEKEIKVFRNQEQHQKNEREVLEEEILNPLFERNEKIFTLKGQQTSGKKDFKNGKDLCEESVKVPKESMKNYSENEEMENFELCQSGSFLTMVKKDNGKDARDNLTSDSSDTTVSCIRKKIDELEEKSVIFKENYLKYKSKYAAFFLSDEEQNGECSRYSSNDCLTDENSGTQRKNDRQTYKASKFSQTEKEKHFFEKSEIEKKKMAAKSVLKADGTTQEKIYSAIHVTRPTKRQQLNREFFLKNRKLLENLEKEQKTNLNISQSDFLLKVE